jgi:hypothetical protein
LSYQSIDSLLTNKIYKYFIGKQLNPFFAEESLSSSGESDFLSAIFKALNSADCLLIIGSKSENFSSGWVITEWRTFLNEIASSRKKGQIILFSGEIAPQKIPLALRSYQIVKFEPENPENSFENLYQFVANSLSFVKTAKANL